MHQRRRTCAGVRPRRSAIRATVSLARWRPVPSGLYASSTIPFARHASSSASPVLVRTELHLVRPPAGCVAAATTCSSSATLKLETPIERRSRAHVRAPSPATPRWARPAASGRCTGRRSRARAARGSLELGDRVRLPRMNFVVTNTSSRGTPLSRSPAPTLSSLPYAWAVSMCRYPSSSAQRTALTHSRPFRHLPDAEPEQRDRVPVRQCALSRSCPVMASQPSCSYCPASAARAEAAMSAFVLA